ncbi:MAG TPA: NB-ARC domain-containing protein [Dehalococcoidia bacterium]|nr:NB-ARC domain-containing protein [Dehalococcoidia bacterium]
MPALAPSNLPAPVTPCIGRERELATIADRLSTVRLLTLIGPGGVGKTRLAIAAAHTVRSAFPDGVWFIDLAPTRDSALVPAVIAQKLGLAESPGYTLRDVLQEALRTRATLLVLDTFEHVLEAAPVVAALLAACPRLRVLATSRAPLRVTGEQQFPVAPLALPAGTLPATVARSPAVTLFVQRAQAVLPEFALSEENAPVVSAICVRLEGLPLALELAAARLAVLPPHELLARLDDRLALLSHGARDLPARQQTLRNTVQWSYDLLPAQAQRLFRALAVCAGGCTLPLAGAISGLAETEALDALTQLTEASLVQRDTAEGSRDEARFRTLDTIRAFALEQLRALDEEAAVRGRHAEYFRALVRSAGPDPVGADQRRWLTRLASELENLRAALRWSLDRGTAEQALWLAAGLGFFWVARGYWEEGRHWLSAALERAQDAQPAARLWAMYQRGAITVQQGDFTAARQ